MECLGQRLVKRATAVYHNSCKFRNFEKGLVKALWYQKYDGIDYMTFIHRIVILVSCTR